MGWNCGTPMFDKFLTEKISNVVDIQLGAMCLLHDLAHTL